MVFSKTNYDPAPHVKAGLRKCGVVWHKREIVTETATSATFSGACNCIATAPRSPPHHDCVDSTTLTARSMAYNLHNTGVDLSSDARASARLHR